MTSAIRRVSLLSVLLTTPLARLADTFLNGALEANLRAWRASGNSWDEIAKLLWAETDRRISITGPTAQSWAEQLGIGEPAEATP